MDWFRLYGEFATDPKVQMLSEADQRRYVMVLCLRCSNEHVTLQDEEVAFQLRISNEEWARTKAALQAKGLVTDDNRPTAWEKRQFRSDSSAARVAEHRRRKKEAGNVDVTLQERPTNAIDTDTDTDTDKPSTASAVEHAQAPDESITHRKTSGTPKRASQLPDDFEPDDTAIALAAEQGVSLAAELPKFRDYHAARGKPMKDWQAALRTWLRNARSFARPASVSTTQRMTRDEGRAIASATRLADFRKAVAAEKGMNDERTIEASAAARLLG